MIDTLRHFDFEPIARQTKVRLQPVGVVGIITPWSLAGYISSTDTERAKHVANRIDASRVCINGFKHDPFAPFGGFKRSGVGREYGAFGLEEYLEPKAVII